MNFEQQVIAWVEGDDLRMEGLRIAASLGLNDWCLAAGFVRNLVWDKLHGYSPATPLNDIDLIYFDASQDNAETDLAVEKTLRLKSSLPWSVKNQARMHTRNGDKPYLSTSHAMSHWVELETAVGAKFSHSGGVELIAPFGIEPLFSNTITINPTRPKPKDFKYRLESKRWLELWPKLSVNDTP